ncbi:MAG: FecR domain-containing protein [Melioribacteraceae bacterium]|nr:FecR domain-containing protein [Melioribacteraceae bacterium]
MKIIKQVFFFTLFIGIALAFTAGNFHDDQTPVALVKKIVKDVQYKSADETDWEAAKMGEPLMDGGEVKTGFQSLALVLFTDGSGLLRVRENSILNIYGEKSKRAMNKNTFIQEGVVGFEVNKQSEDEEFKFTTPTMVASIRGTEGVIDGDQNKVLCESGLIELAALIGQKETGVLTGGNAAQVTEDGQLKIYEMTDAEKQQLQQTKQITIKKIRVETEDGTLEVEYYEEEE